MIYSKIFINGDIREKHEALIPVYDLGLLRGLGIFDFLRVWKGIPVFAEDHIERLNRSLDLVGFKTDLTSADWIEWFYKMIEVNGAERAGFRVVVTGGFSEDGYTIPDKKNIYMMLHHLPDNDPAHYEKGVSLLTSSYQREIPAAKTMIYVQSMRMQPQLKSSGAFEVLYHWKGEITECSRCNIFFIDHNGAIHTPKDGMLKGITRKQVLRFAAENGYDVKEREVRMEELPSMAGAFLTATTKGILPVVKIDDQLIGDGKVHPVATSLQALYEKEVDAYIGKRLVTTTLNP